MPEATLAPADGFTPPAQMFFECSRDGRVLWMNEKARQRLGPVSTLREITTPGGPAELVRFLADPESSVAITGVFPRTGGSALPVRISCFTRLAHSVVLSAEVRERVSDRLGWVSDELLWLHGIVLQNYFRVLRAQQTLDSRRLRSRRSPGIVLIEQLERERGRLGRELHSGPGQWLSAINVHVELIEKLIEKQGLELPAKFREYLGRIAGAAHEAGEELRAVSHRLYTNWESISLPDALRNLWENSGISEKFQASLMLDELPREVPLAVRAALYRAAQEGLTNAVRHSGATQMEMSLQQDHASLCLRIHDNGGGFDPAARPSSRGIGLTSIREQVEALGGEFHVTSGPEGTQLEVLVPLDPLDE